MAWPPTFWSSRAARPGDIWAFTRATCWPGTAQPLEDILPQVLTELAPYREKYGRDIPVFVAGGGLTGADLTRFRGLGAAGVQIATRLIATEECDASQAYKDAILRARAEDVRIIHSPVGMPGRAIYSPSSPAWRRAAPGPRLVRRVHQDLRPRPDPLLHYPRPHPGRGGRLGGGPVLLRRGSGPGE